MKGNEARLKKNRRTALYIYTSMKLKTSSYVKELYNLIILLYIFMKIFMITFVNTSLYTNYIVYSKYKVNPVYF